MGCVLIMICRESAKDAEKLEKVVGDGVPCGNIVGIVVKNLPVLKCEDGVVGNETWFVEEGKRVRGVVDGRYHSPPLLGFRQFIFPSFQKTKTAHMKPGE